VSGVWLDSAPEEHRCRLPFLVPFRVRTGDRWKCRCGRVWRVTESATGREWRWENPPGELEGMKVFRPVTDEQLWCWISQELDLQTRDQDVCAETLVEIIRKHFEIGSRQ